MVKNKLKVALFLILLPIVIVVVYLAKTGLVPKKEIDEQNQIQNYQKNAEDKGNEANWKGYSCALAASSVNQITDSVILSDSLRGCSLGVTYCRDGICTAPIEGIVCNTSRVICGQDIYCKCPRLEDKTIALRLYDDKNNFVIGNGSNIVFTLENATDNPIFINRLECAGRLPILFRKIGERWEKIAPPEWCRDDDIKRVEKIDSRSERSFHWDGKADPSSTGMKYVSKGIYKFGVEYFDSEIMKDGREIYSEEFSIDHSFD